MVKKIIKYISFRPTFAISTSASIVIIMLCVLLTHSCSKSSQDVKDILSNYEELLKLIDDSTYTSCTIDSLKNEIKHSSSDTATLDLVNAIVEEFVNINPKASNIITSEALRYSKAISYPKGEASAWYNQGLYFYYVDIYDSSLFCYNNALAISDSSNLKIPLAKALFGIGNIYRITGQPNIAMDHFDRAVEIYSNLLGSDSSLVDVNKGLAATYDKIGNVYTSKGDFLRALEYTQKSLTTNQEINDRRAISNSLHSIAICYYYLGDMGKALDHNMQSLEIRKELGEKFITSISLQNIGLIYHIQGDLKKALNYYHEGLKINEEMGDKRGVGYSYYHIGFIYKSLKDYLTSLEYFEKSLEIRRELDDKNGIASILIAKGEIYLQIAEGLKSVISEKDTISRLVEDAIELFQESEQIYTEAQNLQGVANSYHALGHAFLFQDNHSSAYEYYSKSLSVYKTTGNKRGITQTQLNLAKIYQKKGEWQNAIDLANNSYTLSKETGILENQRDAAEFLANIYKLSENYPKALRFFEEYTSMRDSVLNIQNRELFEKKHWQLQYEKKTMADSLQNIQKLILKDIEIFKKEEQAKKQLYVIYSLLFVFLSMIVISFFIYKSYRLKSNANRIISEKNIKLEQAYEEIKSSTEAIVSQNEMLINQNNEITKQRNEIEEQRNSLANLAWELQEKGEEIETQRNILSHQNKEITDSIIYAQRIQNAVLPSYTLLGQLFDEHFVYYQPKSIVSGDFYWVTRIRELIVFCVTDCTGHGVPGAFMSMMGVSFLNEIVRKEEVTNAAQVLDQLRDHVISSMEERKSDSAMFDGMDIGLCVLDRRTLQLQYAGANIPCWIASSSFDDRALGERIERLNGLLELKPDRMPIGRYDNMDEFTLLQIQLKKNDTIYMATDGFADQFGGSNGKKYQKNRLMALLSQHHQKPLAEQKFHLEKEFEEWKGTTKQIDDVTVLGVRIL